MKNKPIKVPKERELVIVGDIHEQEWQFDQMIERAEVGTKRILVSVGDIYDRGMGREVAESIIRKIKKLNKDGWAYMVRGNHEQKYINKARMYTKKMTPELKWCESLPISITFMFSNQNIVTVLHGGVTPKDTWSSLKTNEDIMYIRMVDDKGNIVPTKKIYANGKKQWVPERECKTWHEYYDGRFGFIVAGHEPQDDGRPKFFKHSCNIDTKCYETGVLCGQVISNGIHKEFILVEK